MSSFLNRLFTGRKNTANITKDSIENSSKLSESIDSPSRKKKKGVFNFHSSKDKTESVKQNGNSDSNWEFPQPDSNSLSYDSQKNETLERSLEEETREDLKQLQERIDNTNFGETNRRRLAYEIFSDPHSATTKENVRSLSNPDRHLFMSEPNLNRMAVSDDPRGQKEPPPPQREREQLQQQKKRQQQVLQQQQRSTNGYGNMEVVELRKKKPSGFLSGVRDNRAERNSVSNVNSYGNGSTPGMRRSESMYAYVPKAVSLHDASSVLQGREENHMDYAPKSDLLMNRFAREPRAMNQTTSNARQSLTLSFPAASSDPSDDDFSNVTLNVKSGESPTNNSERNPNCRRSASLSNSNIFQRSSSGNENFFFARSPNSEKSFSSFTSVLDSIGVEGNPYDQDLDNETNNNGNNNNDMQNNNKLNGMRSGEYRSLNNDLDNGEGVSPTLTQVNSQNSSRSGVVTKPSPLEVFSVGDVLY